MRMRAFLAILSLWSLGVSGAEKLCFDSFGPGFSSPVEGDAGGRITIEPGGKNAPNGRRTLHLAYDFGTADKTAMVFAGVKYALPKLSRGVDAFDFYLCGDLGGNHLICQLQDADKRWFVMQTVEIGEKSEEGFRHYRIDMKTPPAAAWGRSTASKSPRLPVRQIRFCIQFSLNGLRKGELLLSGLEAILNDTVVEEGRTVYSTAIIPPDVPRPASPQTPHAVLTMRNGLPALSVDGKPFLIFGAQCDVWRSCRRDRQTLEFFDAYSRMNASAVGIDILWSQLEPEKDRYDFSFLDWFLRQAEARNLKVVVQFFGSNVCGKAQESNGYPQYVPDYILCDPVTYPHAAVGNDRQIQLCPNSPALLERELKMTRKLAEYLRDHDTLRTVILLQLDNEVGGLSISQDICFCGECTRLRGVCPVPDSLFTAYSFRNHQKAMADAFAAVYDLPLYLNSPGWSAAIDEIMLRCSPNLDVIGADTRIRPYEVMHTLRSAELLERNPAFRAELPTEAPNTKGLIECIPAMNILQYNGLGFLFWEAPPPHAIVGDAEACRKLGEAFYPIRHAMLPIAEGLGTENVAGYYALDAVKDEFEIREGKSLRRVKRNELDVRCAGKVFHVRGSRGGIIAAYQNGFLIAAASGTVSIPDDGTVPQSEYGVYRQDIWIPSGKAEPVRENGNWNWELAPGRLLRIGPAAALIAPKSAPAAIVEFVLPNNQDLPQGETAAGTVSVTALRDCPPSRLKILTPEGWEAAPAVISLPALHSGEKHTAAWTCRVPAAGRRTQGKIEFSLQNDEQLLGENSLLVRSALPLEIRDEGIRFHADSEGNVTVIVSAVNRRLETQTLELTASGSSLEAPVTRTVPLPPAQWSGIPLTLKLKKGVPGDVVVTVRGKNFKTEWRPAIVIMLCDLQKGPWKFKLDTVSNAAFEKWYSVTCDDRNWGSIRVPGSWMSNGYGVKDSTGKWKPFSGDGYYRTVFRLPAAAKERRLFLHTGAIDDKDEIYLNGVKIAETPEEMEEPWNRERFYPLPAEGLRFEEDNQLTIKVYNGAGDGGIMRGPVAIVAQ